MDNSVIFRAKVTGTDNYSLQFGPWAQAAGFPAALNEELKSTGGRFQIDLMNKTCRPVEAIEGLNQASTVTGFYNCGQRLTLRKAQASNAYNCSYNHQQKAIESISSVTISFRNSEVHAKFERLAYIIESQNEFVKLLLPPQ